MRTRTFAICPPLARYPQHSTLVRGLDHTFGLLPWALKYQPCSNLRSQHKFLSLPATSDPPKSFRLGVFSRFLGGRGREKRCQILDPFWPIFSCDPGAKTSLNTAFLSFLHIEATSYNMVETTWIPLLLLGTCQKTLQIPCCLLPEAKKHCKYRGFALPNRKQHRYLRCFVLQKHRLFDDF